MSGHKESRKVTKMTPKRHPEQSEGSKRTFESHAASNAALGFFASLRMTGCVGWGAARS